MARSAALIRVFVAAPSAALRLALRGRLDGPGLAVVGDGPTPDGAPDDVDVVVLYNADRVLTSPDPRAAAGSRAVVVIADDDRPAHSLRSRPLRGWALVPREATAMELRAATAAAAQGFTVVPSALAPRLLPAPASGPQMDASPESLTPRERQVLDLLAQGLTNRQIAERLGISEHTAKFHVAAVSQKLGAASRTEAVSLGIRQGLITL